MIWLWAIFSSAVFLSGATVSGSVQLRDSRDPAVRKRFDYSGVVISLKPVPGGVAAQSVERHSTMLQKNKMFSPHVLPIFVGTSVDFPNSDPIFHNAFSSYSGQIFDIGLYPPGTTRSVRFTREGIVRVFCNIHSSMSAVILVLRTPYFATTGRDGTFSIPAVPPGDFKLEIFHERATETTLKELERRVTVEEGPLAMPPFAISEAGFLPVPHKNKYGHAYPVESDDHTIYPAVRK